MTKFSCLFLMALATSVVAAHADTTGGELDNSPANVPAALIVQEDAQGNTQVFQSNDATVVADDAAAQTAVAATVTATNEIKNVTTVDELDQMTSNEAWYRGRGGWGGFGGGFGRGGWGGGWGGYGGYVGYPAYNYGWNYAYNYSGYTYAYAPYYNYGWGGYRYHFFRRR
jgi:hypothetical protein